MFSAASAAAATMTPLLLICIILPVFATAETSCPNCIQVNKTCYNASYLFDLEGEFRHQVVVNQLGILRRNRILYYSFEPKIEDPEYYKVGFVDLNHPATYGNLAPPKNVQLNFGCFDFDQDNNIVYLGGSDGVYKFNTLTSSLTHFSSRGDMILSLVYKDNVYFVRERENEIILKKANAFESVLKDDENKTRHESLPKLSVKKFVITNKNIAVFLSRFGLYAAKAEKNSEVYRLSKNSYFRGLAMDLDGSVFTWWLDGIYKVVLESDLSKSKVVRVAKISSVGALTFDDDNSILFTADKAVFRLVKTDLIEC